MKAARSLVVVFLLATTANFAAAQNARLHTIFQFEGRKTGYQVYAGLVLGTNGAFYGATSDNVFQLTPPEAADGPWIETVLHHFDSGQQPLESPLAIGANGELYGVTIFGGGSKHCAPPGCGTVFELVPPNASGGAWTKTTIYRFNGAPDGDSPGGGLVAGQGGVLYGTTQSGGDSTACGPGCGTVFSLAPPSTPGGVWTETVLHSFTGPPDDGQLPTGQLVIGTDGSLYGTTPNGGPAKACSDGCGIVFSLTAPPVSGGSWKEAELHTFRGADGSGPQSLIAGPSGVLYGTTGSGHEARGRVFELIPPSVPGGEWTEAEISRSFDDETSPNPGLALGSGGALYGTTSNGGAVCYFRPRPATHCGSVFQILPPSVAGGEWTKANIHSFTGKDGEGAYPDGGLIIDGNGVLYGTTFGGGRALVRVVRQKAAARYSNCGRKLPAFRGEWYA